MKWLEVACTIPQEASEALCAVVLDWPEVQGVAVEGVAGLAAPHPEYGEWLDESLLDTEEVVVRFYLPEPMTEDAATLRLNTALAMVRQAGLSIGDAPQAIRCHVVDEESWASAWKEDYHPIPVGQKLIIVPQWEMDENASAMAERIPIILEPGMAFGTGTHQTTQLCLEALERLVKKDHRVLDVGCGTAILSIAAAKLGAAEVLALDLDPVAVSAARENVDSNGVRDDVTVMNGNLLEPTDSDERGVVFDGDTPKPVPEGFLDAHGLGKMPHWDVVVANILRDIVILHLPVLRTCLAPHGRLVLSGFVHEQVGKVTRALQENGFEVAERADKDDWSVLVAEVRR